MAEKKRPRRNYGSGGVTERKDGRWAGTIEAGYNAKGGRRRITVYGRTEAEAKAKLKEKKRQIATDGVPEASVSARTTVKAWSDTWLEMTQRTLRPKPWATDRSAVRKWIVPAIGHKRLEQLSPSDVRAVADAQRAAKKSTSTANRTHSTLTSLLRAAIAEGHQVPRRVLDVPAPAVAVNDRTAMSIPDAIAILNVASYLPHGSRWAMAFWHGMRQAECLGLTWDAVNLEVGIVTVEWQLQSLPYIDRKNKALGFRIPDGYEVRHLSGAYHLTRPKSKAGYRVIPLTPAMTEALTDWHKIAPENPWGLVWPRLSGQPTYDRDDREEWYGLQGTAQVGHANGRYYMLHEARHWTASQFLEAGTDPHQVTALMGHSSIMTTRGYQHPSQRAGLEALEAISSSTPFKVQV